MKQQVFYIHGANAFSKHEDFLNYLRTATVRGLPGEETLDIWSRSIAEDLGEDFEVFTPTMPNKQNAKYEEWKIWFERHCEYLRDGIILVGWSQGGYFFAKYLTENDFPFKIKALFLLAAPLKAHHDDTGEDGADFQFDMSRVGELAKRAKKIVIMHSKDDFCVPFEHGEALSKAIPEAEFLVFEDKNHFLIEEFPELVEEIRKVTES